MIMSDYVKEKHINDQIRKLPYSIIQKLAQFLDSPDDRNRNWKALIGAMPNGTYTHSQVSMFDRVGMARGGSSTEALLQDMGHKCMTVKQLVVYLEKIGHDEALELLKPVEPVKIVQHPTSKVVRDGARVEIVCKAIGFPVPHYQWLRNGAEVRHGCDSILVIDKAQAQDNGKYSCIVRNDMMSDISHTAELQVHGTPISSQSPNIREHPVSSLVPVGQDFTLSCHVVEPCSCNYQWFKDGFKLHGKCSQDLKFCPFNYQDEGNYTCKIYNSEGDALTRIATLQSFADPQDQIYRISDQYQRPSLDLTQIAQDKVALCIGNRDYINLPEHESPLVHTCSDAQSLASILRKKIMNFKVISLINLTQQEMNTAVDVFCDLLGENVYGLLYFAGHGFEDRGQNYMVPIDARTDWTPDRAICVQKILQKMHNKKTSLNIFLLDICRKMAVTETSYQTEAFQFPHDAQAIFGFATCPGSEAYERKCDSNGLYMKHLVRNVTEDKKIEEMLHSVAADVEDEVADDEYVSRMRPQFYSKTVRSYSLLDPVMNDDDKSKERNEKWLEYHKLPQKHTLKHRGILVEIRFEHTNWLSNVILVCLRVLDLGEATWCDASLQLDVLPKDFQECHFHHTTTNILRHVVPPGTSARSWKVDSSSDRIAPVPVERISEIYNIQRLKKNLSLTIELKYGMKGSQEEQTKYEIKAFNLKEFGIANAFAAKDEI